MQYKSTAYASFDGMKLSGYLWEPEGEPKGVINLVHGFGEYCDRYDHWAKRFVEKEFVVHAIDYRGHGKSDGRRGHITDFDNFLKDVDVLVNESDKLYPDIPQFIYGHSLGGNIVTNYILRKENNFKGAILSSPWYQLAFKPSPLIIFFARIMQKIFPKFTQKAKLDVKGLSHDNDVVKEYLKDPLVHEKISAKMFFEVYKAGIWVLHNADKLNIPVLLQHGNSDPIISHNASRLFYERAKQLNKNIEYKEWEGLYHELHNEQEKNKVFEFISDWINKKLERE